MESYSICPFGTNFSFGITSLRLIYVVACDKIHFFFRGTWYSIVCIDHIPFIYSSVDGHLGCFHLLAIVNSYHEHGCANISLRFCFQCCWIYTRDFAGHMAVLVLFCFEDLLYSFPYRLHHFTFPPTEHKGFSFFTSSPHICSLLCFW